MAFEKHPEIALLEGPEMAFDNAPARDPKPLF